MTPFLIGINYWPRKSAMYMWQRFDIGEIREDMARIAALGLHVVRFFVSWDVFAPASDTIDRNAMSHLVEIMDAIGNAGLKAMPTLFCGHMSGVNWLPHWSLDPATPHGRFRTIAGGRESAYGIGDFYADEGLLRAQTLLAQAAAEQLKGHRALSAWDLGNEFSNLREPANPQDAARWSQRLSDVLRETSGAGASGGMHGEDLERDRHIRPSSIARPWEFATMHGYSVYSIFSRGRRDTEVVPFLSAVQAACSGKPVLFTEAGAPGCPQGTVSPYDRVPLPGQPPPKPDPSIKNAAPYACLTEDETAAYATTVFDRLQQRGALGAFWWCWADYDPSLAHLPPFDRAPHELRFGIIRCDGTLKPVAHALEAYAAQRRVVQPQPPPIVDEGAYFASLPDAVFQAYAAYCKAHE